MTFSNAKARISFEATGHTVLFMGASYHTTTVPSSSRFECVIRQGNGYQDAIIDCEVKDKEITLTKICFC